jgi:hypothetical protein
VKRQPCRDQINQRGPCDKITVAHAITSSAIASKFVGAERLGGLEVDHQLIFERLLHWQLGRLLAF